MISNIYYFTSMRVFHNFSTIFTSMEKNVIIEKKNVTNGLKKKIHIEFISYI